MQVCSLPIELAGKPYDEKMNLNSYFTPYSKMNLKRNIDLNVKCETMKLLKDKTGYLQNLGIGSFLHGNQKSTNHKIKDR